jgi:hypothetical protein
MDMSKMSGIQMEADLPPITVRHQKSVNHSKTAAGLDALADISIINIDNSHEW